MTFPHPCNRCGFCCLAVECPVELLAFGKRKPGERCPALSFEGDQATCAMGEVLGPDTMGFGTGCDTSAKVFRNGAVADFASLPGEHKILVVQQIRSGRGIVKNTGELKRSQNC